MAKLTSKLAKRTARRNRIRARVIGSAEKPRLSVFRSNKHITVQLIDDVKAETIAYVWTKNLDGKTLKEKSVSAGKAIAELAKAKKIVKVVFDRGGYLFRGNIKVVADSARTNGLEF